MKKVNKHELKQNEDLAKIQNVLAELFKHYRLDQILEATSKQCLTHAKGLLNEDKAVDSNGNTLRVLLEFNERIMHLVWSARRKNKHSPIRGMARDEWEMHKMSKPVRAASVGRYDKETGIYKERKITHDDDIGED